MLIKICLLLALLGMARSSGEEMLHCDFEDGLDCEGWSNSDTSSSRWVVMEAGNDVPGSPKKDSTVGETGHYLGFAPGKIMKEEVEYESPAFSFATDFNDEFCLQFYYFVSGFMGRLKIFHSGSEDVGYTPVGLKSLMAERRRRQWNRYTATVKKSEGDTGIDRVVIKASAFWIPSKTGFFAIDDIWISKGSCEDMEKMYMKPETTPADKTEVEQPTQPSDTVNEDLEEENARRNREELERIKQQEEYNRMRNENPDQYTTKQTTTQKTTRTTTTGQQPTQPTQPDNSVFNNEPDPVTLDWRMNNPDFKMCGSSFVNVSSEICCRGFPQPTVPNAMCCGPFACDPDTEVCCGEEPFLKAESTKKCCGQYAYDTRTQGCCGGHRVYYLSNLAEQCCGHQLYDATTQSCCGHQIYKYGRKRCCVNTVYSTLWFGCCNGQKFPIRTQKCSAEGNIVRKEKVFRWWKRG